MPYVPYDPAANVAVATKSKSVPGKFGTYVPYTPIGEKPKGVTTLEDPNDIPVLEQEEPRSFYQKIKDTILWPQINKDKASNIVGLAKMHDMPVIDVMHNYDDLTEGMRDNPTNKEMLSRVGEAGLLGALITNPVATLATLAPFVGLEAAKDYIVNAVNKDGVEGSRHVSELYPNGTPTGVQAASDLLEFVGIAAASHYAGSAAMAKLSSVGKGMVVMQAAHKAKISGESIGNEIRATLKAKGGSTTPEGAEYIKRMQDIHTRGKAAHSEVVAEDAVIQSEFAGMNKDVQKKAYSAIFNKLTKTEQTRIISKHRDKSGVKFKLGDEKKIVVPPNIDPDINTIDGLHDAQVNALNTLGQELKIDAINNSKPGPVLPKKAEFTPIELDTLIGLGVKFQKESVMTLAEFNAKSPDEKTAIREWRKFSRVHSFDEELAMTKEEKKLTLTSNKAVTDLVGDFDAFIGDITDGAGKVITGKLDAGKIAAKERLITELELIKRDAMTEGKSVEEFLISNDRATPKQAELVKRYMDTVFEDTFPGEFKRVQSGKVSGDAEKAWSFIQASRKAMKEARKVNVYDSVKGVQAALTDRTTRVNTVLENDLSTLSQKTLMDFERISGASTTASAYYNKISPHIFYRHNNVELEAFEDLVHIKKELSIAGRTSGRVGPEGADYETLLPQIQHRHGLSDARMEVVFDSVNNLFTAMGDMLAKSKAEGLVSSDLYTILKDNQYSPTNWLKATKLYSEYISNSSTVGKPVLSLTDLENAMRGSAPTKAGSAQVKSSGINRLGKGVKDDYQNLNVQEALATVVNNTYDKVFKNRATRSLSEYTNSLDPVNGTLIKAKINSWGVDQQGNMYPVYAKPPAGYKALNYFDYGQRKELCAEASFAEHWDAGNNNSRHIALNILHHASLASTLRVAATGILKPFFGITRGLLMDIPYSYFVLQQVKDMKHMTLYSANPVKFAAEMATNMVKVAGDVFMSKGRYLDVLEQGGFTGTVGTVGSARAHAKSKTMHDIEMLNEFGNYLNTKMEQWIRISNREQYIKQGYPPEDATARMLMGLNYNKGGWLTKIGDRMVPYTNVGVISTANVYKSGKNDPKTQSYKLAYMTSMAAAYYLFNRLRFPEAMKQESDFNKDGNYIQPTGFSFEDRKGNKRYVNLKLKKEPTLAPYMALTEMLMARAMGDEVEFSRALKSFVSSGRPAATGFLPPIANFGITLAYGKDSFSLQDIWKKAPAGKGEWSPDKTSQLWYDIGQGLNVSPDKLKDAIGEVLTSGSMAQSGIENAYDAAFRTLPQKHQNTMMADFFLSNWKPGFVSITSEVTNVSKGVDEKEEDIEAKKVFADLFIDAYSDQYYNEDKTDEDRKKTYEFIKNKFKEYTLDPDEQRRLVERFVNFGPTKSFPHQSTWLFFGGINDQKLRAQEVAKWRSEQSMEEQREIDMRLGVLKQNKSGIVPSDGNAPFWREYYKIVYTQGKGESK
jgi:hypothetical protein